LVPQTRATPVPLKSAPAPESPSDTSPHPFPNAWLAPILAQAPIRFDWLSSLLYASLAERFGNSREGTIGMGNGWAVALGDVTDLSDPGFKGVFLTQKGGFGFFGPNAMVRFHRGVVFIGSRESVLEGIGVDLLGAGLDEQGDLVFIVSDGFASRFDVADKIVARELARVREASAILVSEKEVLETTSALEMVWTVPAEQPNPLDPQAVESTRPAA
jgi:hypothetical protein